MRIFATLGVSIAIVGALAQQGGTFEKAGSTEISAMMLFLGNEEKVYILDKAENNAAQINGHPAWGAVWDLPTRQVNLMDIYTNSFCASGMHLPNGSFVTLGGNGAVGPGGANPSNNATNINDGYDDVIGDWSGLKSIRVLNPCFGDPADANFTETNPNPDCQWYDDPSVLSMQVQRWYSTAEPLSDGSIAIIGGFAAGGYINRNWNNSDPLSNFGADFTYEFFPADGRNATQMQFMITTSGLNAYAHAYMMPSGKMFLQANLSTILWEPSTNTEFPLPDMPNNTPRVYPASGATAMLPLTPVNNYSPTVLFCGGTNMTWEQFGNYSAPMIDTFYYGASKDCHSITPEPEDGSDPEYVQDDDLPIGRSMGQFIALPDGTMLLVNGGEFGTAGYSKFIWPDRPTLADMPFGESLASGPVLQPVIYDPRAPAGSRFTSEGLNASTIPRMYHSSAILLPDASVFIAGSNPNIDVNISTIYPTTYTAEIFYPPYFSAPSRPTYTGAPSVLTYGGSYFNLTVPPTSYSGNANDAAANTTVWLMRPGFTTHAMNMGQRSMQLNNTFTVSDTDGSITLHVSQPPPNANLMQPGPSYLFVTIAGIPSNGTYVIVGSGNIEEQSLLKVQSLPDSVRATVSVNGTAPGSPNSDNDTATTTSSLSTGALVGIIIGAVVAVAILGGLARMYFARQKRSTATWEAAAHAPGTASGAADGEYGVGAVGTAYATKPQPAFYAPDARGPSLAMSEYSSVPLRQDAIDSTPSFEAPYSDAPQGYHDVPLASSPASHTEYGGGYEEAYAPSPRSGQHF